MNYQIISLSPLFSGISTENIELLFKQIHYRVMNYSKNDFIVQQGSVLEELRLILSGSVRSEISNEQHTTKVADLHAPKVLAPSFLFGKDNKYPVDVIANASVKILCIPKVEFLKLMQLNSQLMSNYLDIVSSRAQFLAKRIQLLSLRTIKEKVAKYLLDLAGDNLQSFELPMTQTMLAEYFAVARPPLSKIFTDLSKEGIIKINTRTIYLLDKNALRNILRK
ncbi:MAG: Crp/Fnr family transcriptional regulator [Mangrovibacterium sp.]